MQIKGIELDAQSQSLLQAVYTAAKSDNADDATAALDALTSHLLNQYAPENGEVGSNVRDEILQLYSGSLEDHVVVHPEVIPILVLRRIMRDRELDLNRKGTLITVTSATRMMRTYGDFFFQAAPRDQFPPFNEQAFLDRTEADRERRLSALSEALIDEVRAQDGFIMDVRKLAEAALKAVEAA